jgi:hypothetical protein
MIKGQKVACLEAGCISKSGDAGGWYIGVVEDEVGLV